MNCNPSSSVRVWTVMAPLLAALSVSPLSAQIVETRFDILGPGDPGYDDAPADLFIIDAFIDVAATDAWIASAVDWMESDPSVGLVLQFEPKPPRRVVITNPHDPYVTSVSRPLDRNPADRWWNSGVVAGATMTNPGEGLIGLSVTWMQSPPESDGVDGYIARLVFEFDAVAPPRETVVLGTEHPPDGVNTLAFAIWTNVSEDRHFTTSELYLWSNIPEPGSGALLLFGFAAVASRRRSLTQG